MLRDYLYYEEAGIQLFCGDALTVLRALPDASAQTCITSPPYWGLRDYGVAGQLGLEPTPEEYVAALVAVFAEVRRVLRDDGTLWLNLGDSYVGGKTNGPEDTFNSGHWSNRNQRRDRTSPGLKPKDLVGIPWRVAFALQADGWYLRSDIIWHKPNPMPESVTDRPTKAHEYLFLLSKSERYYYDASAIAERATYAGKTVTLGEKSLSRGQAAGAGVEPSGNGTATAVIVAPERNRRTVWTIATEPYPGAHFATFPPDLVKPCVQAGSRPGGVVVDPFVGSGTAVYVAKELGRAGIGIDLRADYLDLATRRLAQGVLFGASEPVEVEAR